MYFVFVLYLIQIIKNVIEIFVVWLIQNNNNMPN